MNKPILISILASSNLVALNQCIKSAKTAIQHSPNYNYKIAVILNSLNQQFKTDTFKWLAINHPDIISVHSKVSNGAPGKGHNAVLNYFRRHAAEYSYNLMIDGDDIIYPYALSLLEKAFTTQVDVLLLMINDHVSSFDHNAYHIFQPPSCFFYTAHHEMNWWLYQTVPTNPFTHSIHECKTPARVLLIRSDIYQGEHADVIKDKMKYDEEAFLYDDYGICIRLMELHQQGHINLYCTSNTDLYAYNSMNDDSTTRVFRCMNFVHQDNIGFLKNFDSSVTNETTREELIAKRKQPYLTDEQWSKLIRAVKFIEFGLTQYNFNIQEKLNYYASLVIEPAVRHALDTKNVNLLQTYYHSVPQTLQIWSEMHRFLFNKYELVSSNIPNIHKIAIVMGDSNNIYQRMNKYETNAFQLAQMLQSTFHLDVVVYANIPHDMDMGMMGDSKKDNIRIRNTKQLYTTTDTYDAVILTQYIHPLVNANLELISRFGKIFYWVQNMFFMYAPNVSPRLSIPIMANLPPNTITRYILTSHWHRNIQRQFGYPEFILKNMSMLYHAVPDDVFMQNYTKIPYSFVTLNDSSSHKPFILDIWPQLVKTYPSATLCILNCENGMTLDISDQPGIEMVHISFFKDIYPYFGRAEFYINGSDVPDPYLMALPIAAASKCITMVGDYSSMGELSVMGMIKTRKLCWDIIKDYIDIKDKLAPNVEYAYNHVKQFSSWSFRVREWYELLNSSRVK